MADIGICGRTRPPPTRHPSHRRALSERIKKRAKSDADGAAQRRLAWTAVHEWSEKVREITVWQAVSNAADPVNSRGGTRTRTGDTPHRILNPVRLPIPPLGLKYSPVGCAVSAGNGVTEMLPHRKQVPAWHYAAVRANVQAAPQRPAALSRRYTSQRLSVARARRATGLR